MQTMTRRPIWLLAAVVLAAVLLAPTGRRAAAEDAQWLGQFWNNRDLSGTPVLTRWENTIDFNWGEGSPAPQINDDNFSARWTRRVFFEEGNYRFFATMDDGMRIWIDDQLIIDSWTDSQEHTMTVDRFLTRGDHSIRIDYFEAGGMAVAQFSWQPLGSGGGGGGGGDFYPNWKGEYFNNVTLGGPPSLVRDDRYLNFNWGYGSPAPQIFPDFFSARWTRTYANPTPGQYRIFLTSDDGSRLFINNQLIIDNWADQALTTKTVDYWHPGGPITVRVEYFEGTGQAAIRVGLLLVPGGTGVLPVLPPGGPNLGGGGSGGSGGGGTGGCPSVSGLNAVVISTTPLNVRRGPGTQYEAFTQLQPCQVVPLTGNRNPDGTWVQIVVPGGQIGWVASQYVRTGVPVSSLTPVTG